MYEAPLRQTDKQTDRQTAERAQRTSMGSASVSFHAQAVVTQQFHGANNPRQWNNARGVPFLSVQLPSFYGYGNGNTATDPAAIKAGKRRLCGYRYNQAAPALQHSRSPDTCLTFGSFRRLTATFCPDVSQL